MLPMSIDSSLLIVKEASRFVCLHDETANRHASFIGNSDVPAASLLVFVRIVNNHTFRLYQTLFASLHALLFCFQRVIVDSVVGRHILRHKR